MADRREKIGKVGVDSGLLVICDPCYIKHDGTEKQLNDYKRLVKLMGGEASVQLKSDTGYHDLAVAFRSGGDGTYEVWATIGEDGRLKKVEIILIK